VDQLRAIRGNASVRGRKDVNAMKRSRSRLLAWLIAAATAGTLSTLAQIVLWIAFTDAFPDILARDARLAAALLLGQRVLPPPATFDATVMIAATVVHGVLSLAYTGVIALLVQRRPPAVTAAVGAVFGGALYLVNMYGFTWVFPWFAAARDWITAAAHLAFGISGAVVYRWCAMRHVRI
jgi:hypothetical protein